MLYRTQAGGEPLSREASPEDEAIRNEAPPQRLDLSSDEIRRVKRAWLNMQRFRPDLFAVFRAWVDATSLRDEGTRYSHGVYRGWYAEQAKRLRMPESSVRSKLDTARKWFAARLRAADRQMSRRG